MSGLIYGRNLAYQAGAAQGQQAGLSRMLGLYNAPTHREQQGRPTGHNVFRALQHKREDDAYDVEQANRVEKEADDFEKQKIMLGLQHGNAVALEGVRSTNRDALQEERLAAATERAEAAATARATAAETAAGTRATAAEKAAREREEQYFRSHPDAVVEGARSDLRGAAEKVASLVPGMSADAFKSMAAGAIAAPYTDKEKRRDLDERKADETAKKNREMSAYRTAKEAAIAEHRKWLKAQAEAKAEVSQDRWIANLRAVTRRFVVGEAGNEDSPYYAKLTNRDGTLNEAAVNAEVDRITGEAMRDMEADKPAPGASGTTPTAATPTGTEGPYLVAKAYEMAARLSPQEAAQQAAKIRRYIEIGMDSPAGPDVDRVLEALDAVAGTMPKPAPKNATGQKSPPWLPPPLPEVAPDTLPKPDEQTAGNYFLDKLKTVPLEMTDAAFPGMAAARKIGETALSPIGSLIDAGINATGYTGQRSFEDAIGNAFADENGQQSAAGRAAGMALDAVAQAALLLMGGRAGGSVIRRLRKSSPAGPLPHDPNVNTPRASVPPGARHGPPRPPPTVRGQAVNPTPPDSAPGLSDADRAGVKFAEAKAKAAEALKGVNIRSIETEISKVSAARMNAKAGTHERAKFDAMLQSLIDEHNRRTGGKYKMPNVP